MWQHSHYLPLPPQWAQPQRGMQRHSPHRRRRRWRCPPAGRPRWTPRVGRSITSIAPPRNPVGLFQAPNESSKMRWQKVIKEPYVYYIKCVMKLTSSSYNSYLFNYSFLGFFAYVYNIYIHICVCNLYVVHDWRGVFVCFDLWKRGMFKFDLLFTSISYFCNILIASAHNS